MRLGFVVSHALQSMAYDFLHIFFFAHTLSCVAISSLISLTCWTWFRSMQCRRFRCAILNANAFYSPRILNALFCKRYWYSQVPNVIHTHCKLSIKELDFSAACQRRRRPNSIASQSSRRGAFSMQLNGITNIPFWINISLDCTHLKLHFTISVILSLDACAVNGRISMHCSCVYWKNILANVIKWQMDRIKWLGLLYALFRFIPMVIKRKTIDSITFQNVFPSRRRERETECVLISIECPGLVSKQKKRWDSGAKRRNLPISERHRTNHTSPICAWTA